MGHYQQIINTAKQALTRTFIEPWLCRKKRWLYFSTLLANIGLSMLTLFLTFDIAGLGLYPLLCYFLMVFSFGYGFILPCCFLLLGIIGFKKLFALLITSQGMMLCIFLYLENYPFWFVGLFQIMLNNAFIMAYHVSMMLHTSDSNRGSEVALGEAGLTSGSVIGSFAGGMALAFSDKYFVLLFASLIVPLATASIMLALIKHERELGKKGDSCFKSDHSLKSCLDELRKNPANSYATMAEGCFNAATFITMPVWLKILGVSGLAVGTISALRVILQLLLAPFLGALVDRDNGNEVKFGAILNFIGWIPWLFIQSPVLLLYSLIFWTSGNYLYASGLICRWYESRTLASMAAREVLLGVGRTVVLIIVTPLMFFSLQSFISAAIFISGVMILNGCIFSRSCVKLSLLTSHKTL